jgi:hypothetical protein
MNSSLAAMKSPLLLLLVLTLGCGGDSSGRFAISGTVTLDGEPVPTGAIAVIPTPGTDAPTSGGSIHDGEYSIPASQGPTAGRYRVEIRWPREAGQVELYPGESGAKFEEAIPAKYNSKSTLEIQVGEGSTEHNFDLTTRGA